MSSIRIIVDSNSIIDPGRLLNKHHAINIETFANKKSKIIFPNFLENNGTLRRIVIIMTIPNKVNKSKTLGRIKAIILKINVIEIFVIGCNFANIEVEGI